jgi:hypothetical protein
MKRNEYQKEGHYHEQACNDHCDTYRTFLIPVLFPFEYGSAIRAYPQTSTEKIAPRRFVHGTGEVCLWPGIRVQRGQVHARHIYGQALETQQKDRHWTMSHSYSLPQQRRRMLLAARENTSFARQRSEREIGVPLNTG